MARFTWIGSNGGSEECTAVVNKLMFRPPYGQVMPASNRNMPRTWTRLFSGADKDAANDIVKFIRDHQGAIAFDWTTPDGEDVAVICERYRFVYQAGGRRDLEATFTEWMVGGT